MSDKATLRSGMLGMIYNMLPHIDDDYAAKMVYTLEDKKSIAQLQQDIANIAAQLSSDSPLADTITAKVLLDEISLPAALKRLHIYNNATSIAELGDVLKLTPAQLEKLTTVYASFASRLYFDVELEHALSTVKENLSEEQQARQAVEKLLAQADKRLTSAASYIEKNKADIFKWADTYHLSVKLTAQLINLYTQPESILFTAEFEQLLKLLTAQCEQKALCASLAARAMLCQITPKDAQDIALLHKLLHRDLLEEDLLVIACRYLRVKTPQEIARVFEAVLHKLPHVKEADENLGLAVRVLLDGTQASLLAACQKAQLAKDRQVLLQKLEKDPLYNGYEADLAEHFGGKKEFKNLHAQMLEILNALPFCSEPQENKELACKVLLGSLGREEAVKQAAYSRNLKATTLTQGLAPEILKSYLGTKPAAEIIQFFNERLSSYTFWKSQRPKHILALRVLVGELNGTFNRRISDFVLEMLEKGSSLDLMNDMLHTIQAKKNNPEELEELLLRYKQARAASKTA